jgi:hypothetical protein
MHAVHAIQVGGVDVPVQHAPVAVDEGAVNVRDSAATPVPAVIPAVIRPGPYRDRRAKREQAAGDDGFGVILRYVN